VVSGHSVSDRSLIADWLMAVSRDRPPRIGYIMRRTVVKVSSQTVKWQEQSSRLATTDGLYLPVTVSSIRRYRCLSYYL